MTRTTQRKIYSGGPLPPGPPAPWLDPAALLAFGNGGLITGGPGQYTLTIVGELPPSSPGTQTPPTTWTPRGIIVYVWRDAIVWYPLTGWQGVAISSPLPDAPDRLPRARATGWQPVINTSKYDTIAGVPCPFEIPDDNADVLPVWPNPARKAPSCFPLQLPGIGAVFGVITQLNAPGALVRVTRSTN
jgi:hypothetical protein